MASIGYVQITRECNQKCRFCSNPPTGYQIKFNDGKKIIDSFFAKGYESLFLTGGEPTLNPDLPRYIDYVRKKGMVPRLITNAQKLATISYVRTLKNAGLRNLNVSLYSVRPDIQACLSNNKKSFSNINKALKNMASVGSMEVNINTVINKLNAGHLLENVRWIRENFDFIKHFNWNNMDPAMASGSGFDKALIPRLNDFELSLYNAMAYLVNEKCTFRAERVPLCYMTYFAAYSTETRKIVKDEERRVYFLDKRGIFEQQRWDYDKAPACLVCSVNDICAGLYRSDAYYSARELYPLFIKKNEIIDAIRSHA